MKRGFTLVELMVTIAILAILATFAAPSFTSFIGTMRAKSAAFDLVGDLILARSEALKLNEAVQLEAIDGDWAKGWRVTVVSSGRELRTRSAPGSSVAISGADTLTFRANGRPGDDTSTDLRRWAVKSTISGVQARCVQITPTGTARSKLGDCA